MTFTSEASWKAWKEAKKKRNSHDESKRCESSKSKTSSSSASGRRPSAKQHQHKQISSHTADTSERSHSHSHTGNRRGSHKARSNSKAKAESSQRDHRGSESSTFPVHDMPKETKASKSKSHRKRDVMSNSAHGAFYSPTGSWKKGETIKIRSKNGHRKSSTSVLSPPDTPSSTSGAVLDISNGSFFDSNDDFSSEHPSLSSSFMRTSLSAPKLNEVHSFNEHSFNNVVNSWVESDEKIEKERKKKKRGKKGGSLGSGHSGHSESKPRSRSADESRTGNSTKSRRGRRGSKAKISLFDEPESPAIDRPSLSQEGGSHKNSHKEKGKHHKSPKLIVRKHVSNESGDRQRKPSKSPKFLTKKNLEKPRGSPETNTRKKDKRGSSSKSHTLFTPSSRDADPIVNISKHRLIQSDIDVMPPFNFEEAKSASKEEKVTDEDDFYDLALSSWVDEHSEIQNKVPKGMPYPPKLNSPVKNEALRRKELTKKARWNPEPSPSMNLMSPMGNCNTVAARVPRFDEMSSPVIDVAPTMPKSPQRQIPRFNNTPNPVEDTQIPPPPASPPRSPEESKKIDFPLNFVEYQDISPLTVASRKVSSVDVQLLQALQYLQS